MLTSLAAAILRILRDERAQTLAEYGLLISLVAVAAVLTSILVFRDTLIAAFESVSACLQQNC